MKLSKQAQTEGIARAVCLRQGHSITTLYPNMGVTSSFTVAMPTPGSVSNAIPGDQNGVIIPAKDLTLCLKCGATLEEIRGSV